MARIRTLKPEALEDEKAAQLSDAAWRLWVSMILLADDHGNLRADPIGLTGRVFPYPTKGRPPTPRLLEELEDAGLVSRYTVREQSYINYPTWSKHQRIDNAGKRRVPGPDEADAEFRGNSPQDSADCRDLPLDPDPDPEHRNIGGAAPETAAPPSVARVFPCQGDPGQWALTHEQIKTWQSDYEHLDVAQEMKKAWNYIDANPTKKKTARGYKRYLVGWLNRAVDQPSNGAQPARQTANRKPQELGPPTKVPTKPPPLPEPITDEQRARNAEKARAMVQKLSVGKAMPK